MRGKGQPGIKSSKPCKAVTGDGNCTVRWSLMHIEIVHPCAHFWQCSERHFNSTEIETFYGGGGPDYVIVTARNGTPRASAFVSCPTHSHPLWHPTVTGYYCYRSKPNLAYGYVIPYNPAFNFCHLFFFLSIHDCGIPQSTMFFMVVIRPGLIMRLVATMIGTLNKVFNENSFNVWRHPWNSSWGGGIHETVMSRQIFFSA